MPTSHEPLPAYIAEARNLLLQVEKLLGHEVMPSPIAFASDLAHELAEQLERPNHTLIVAAWSLLARDGGDGTTDELMLALARIVDLAAHFTGGDGSAMEGVELMYRLDALKARLQTFALAEF